MFCLVNRLTGRSQCYTIGQLNQYNADGKGGLDDEGAKKFAGLWFDVVGGSVSGRMRQPTQSAAGKLDLGKP